MKARTAVAGRGKRRACYVTPDLSYELEGEREEKMCEDNEWDEKNKNKKNREYKCGGEVSSLSGLPAQVRLRICRQASAMARQRWRGSQAPASPVAW